MDGNQGAAVLRDECNKDSVEEMRRRLEEAERRNVELETSLNQAVARSQQMLRIPLNRQAYRRELLSKFIAFVENRRRFLEALQRVCDECKSARKQTNLATIGVGTVGILASLQRHAQMAGSVISLMAVALNTFLAVKGNFNEATRIRQLEKLEETDLKLIGQLLSAYDEFCTLFEVEKRVGNEDVMRLHISEVVSWIVTFVEEIGTARLSAMTGVTNIRDVVNYGCFNAIFPVLGSIGSSKLPDSFGSLLNMISLLVCTGNVFITFEDNFRSGYSESNSSTMHEHKAYRDFFNISVAPYTLGLVGECVDGGSILRPEIFAEMKGEVQRGLSKQVRSDDPMESRQTLADYLIFSDENHFTAIDEAINFPNENVVAGYPYYTIFNRRLSMERIMYGWHNHSVNMLWYMMVFRPDTPEVVNRIKETELEWNQELEKKERGILQLSLYGDEVVNHEIHRASINTIPYFFVGATAMILLVFFAVLRYKQNIYGTMFLTFWTVLCPLMAALMSLAIFTLYGIPINCMMLITPFLVLGVGVDNSFLMMHDWFQSKEIDGSGRLSVVLISAGPSVTLTSLTNIAAFLIGSALSPPDVRSFCLCSALALTFHWIFQFCVFAPALLRFHCCKYKLPAAVGQTAYSPAFISYSWFLRKRFVRLLAISVLLIYWSVSIYSAIQMQENFSPRKTFDTESFLAKSLDRYERVFADHEMIYVIAKELPKDVKSLYQVEATIHSLEYLCDNFTTWMEDYEAEYRPTGNNIQEYFSELRTFVDSNPDLLRRVMFDVKDDESMVVKKVSFDICVQGTGKWRDRAMMVKNLRSRMPDGYSIYVYDSAVFDLILSTRRAMTKSVLTTLACLILLCVLFIPAVHATSVAVISVISIAIGVIGGLGAWGADLDVIVMVNVVMAIGLTVDFTAHVSYRCFSGDPNESRVEKVAHGIEMIAFPTALAALTTLLCALPLYFYRVYMYVFFAKTIILSALLGYLHAVFVIPLLVSLF